MSFLSIAMVTDLGIIGMMLWKLISQCGVFFFFSIAMVTDLGIGINDVMETDQLMWHFFPLLWSPT